MILLGAMMAAALSGLLGGGKPATLRALAPEGELALTTPLVLRNGLFFEQKIEVSAARPIDDLVIGVSDTLWRDMTINSQIPSPADEESKDGEIRMHFGPLKPGSAFALKVDGQINPPLRAGREGVVTWYDGERPLASVPLKLKVLP